MLSMLDKAYLFDFLSCFEQIKKEPNKYHFKEASLQKFLNDNRIYIGSLSDFSEKKCKRKGYHRFVKVARVSAFEILRHIRNAIAHGRIEYQSKNVLKLTDYSSRTQSFTMKASIRRDLMISLIKEIKKTYQ